MQALQTSESGSRGRTLRRIRIWGLKCCETSSRGENNGKTNILKFSNLFPNRSLLLRVLMAIKEGSPRKHTQSVQRHERWPGPRPHPLFENSSGFTIKVKIYFLFYVREKFATVKIRVWRFITKSSTVLYRAKICKNPTESFTECLKRIIKRIL